MSSDTMTLLIAIMLGVMFVMKIFVVRSGAKNIEHLMHYSMTIDGHHLKPAQIHWIKSGY